MLHVFLGEAAADPQAVKRFIRRVCETYQPALFHHQPDIQRLPVARLLRGELPHCPAVWVARRKFISRVVGYCRPVSQWNEGKQAEFRHTNTLSIGDLP